MANRVNWNVEMSVTCSVNVHPSWNAFCTCGSGKSERWRRTHLQPEWWRSELGHVHNVYKAWLLNISYQLRRDTSLQILTSGYDAHFSLWPQPGSEPMQILNKELIQRMETTNTVSHFHCNAKERRKANGLYTMTAASCELCSVQKCDQRLMWLCSAESMRSLVPKNVFRSRMRLIKSHKECTTQKSLLPCTLALPVDSFFDSVRRAPAAAFSIPLHWYRCTGTRGHQRCCP